MRYIFGLLEDRQNWFQNITGCFMHLLLKTCKKFYNPLFLSSWCSKERDNKFSNLLYSKWPVGQYFLGAAKYNLSLTYIRHHKQNINKITDFLFSFRQLSNAFLLNFKPILRLLNGVLISEVSVIDHCWIILC